MYTDIMIGLLSRIVPLRQKVWNLVLADELPAAKTTTTTKKTKSKQKQQNITNKASVKWSECCWCVDLFVYGACLFLSFLLYFRKASH